MIPIMTLWLLSDAGTPIGGMVTVPWFAAAVGVFAAGSAISLGFVVYEAWKDLRSSQRRIVLGRRFGGGCPWHLGMADTART